MKKNQNLLTLEQEYKLKTYDTLVAERDMYKRERNEFIKNKASNQEAKTLMSRIDEKIINAYKDRREAFGRHILLMQTILDWEYSGNQHQKEAVREKKAEINKLIRFLKEYSYK